MPTTLDILVFVASPLDYARYRHTALYIEFGEDKSTDAGARPNSVKEESVRSSVMEIVGSPGFFSFSERVNAEPPAQATSLAHTIRICEFPEDVSLSTLRDLISRTPIPRVIVDWNSQNWVGDVLARLVQAGYIDADTNDRCLDEMVDAVIEANDEEIA